MEHFVIIDNTLEEDNETLAAELHSLLLEGRVSVQYYLSAIQSTRQKPKMHACVIRCWI